MVQWPQIETWKTPFEHLETVFNCEGDQALDQVAIEVVQSPAFETLEACLGAVLNKLL